MQMVEHVVDVHGSNVCNGRRSPDAVGSVLRCVEPLLRDAVNMAFRYKSRVKGRKPDWLKRATTVRFADVSDGDDCTRLHFEVPRLGEAASDLYQQHKLFETPPDEKDTCFDLVGDVFRDILDRPRDSDRFDTDLLKRVGRFSSAVSKRGVDSLILRGDRLPEDLPPTLDSRMSKMAVELRREIPEPKRSRVAGKLDMIRDSDGAFSLILNSGETIHGILEDDKSDVFAHCWRQFVVVEGKAVFRPSGLLLRIEAEAMELAGEADAFFSTIPKATPARFDVRRVREPQTSTSGVGAVFGKWPGDETEEELLAALRREH
jgi:hypothetical protein